MVTPFNCHGNKQYYNIINITFVNVSCLQFQIKRLVLVRFSQKEARTMSDTDEMRKAGITYDETVEFAATGVLPFSFRIRRFLSWLVPTLLVFATLGTVAAIVLTRYS